jgi:hypothetical protein
MMAMAESEITQSQRQRLLSSRSSVVLFSFSNGLLAIFNACGWPTCIPHPLQTGTTNNIANTCNTPPAARPILDIPIETGDVWSRVGNLRTQGKLRRDAGRGTVDEPNFRIDCSMEEYCCYFTCIAGVGKDHNWI